MSNRNRLQIDASDSTVALFEEIKAETDLTTTSQMVRVSAKLLHEVVFALKDGYEIKMMKEGGETIVIKLLF